MVKINNKQHITKNGIVKNNPRKNIKYEVVFDVYGKPYSEYASTEKQLESLLRKGYELAQNDENFDTKVYYGELDISESQLVNELVRNIIE